MPAALFPIALVGSLLLLWAALRAHSHQKPIGWSFFAMIIFLFSSQRIAIATGLASGTIPPTGWPFILTISLIILYSLALIETGTMGILLVKKIYS